MRTVLLILLSIVIASEAQKKSSVQFKVPDNFKINVFADKELINNPISIAIDSKNRVYVAEIHRFQKGVEDSRRFNEWFLDEIACNSLQDRIDLYEKWIGKGLFKKGHFTAHSDRIVTLFDKNNDGQADGVKEFSGKYNGQLDGNGSSILLGKDGEMYYANIPYIWKISDADGDGVSEKKEKFISGFGFRSGVNGHDLHGLEWGVDGRLYFSNGDRGYGIKTKEGKTLYSSERGAVFRCEPDGSNLEVFTVGNRNPQDLAFDQYGNMFTVDNNRGRGDRSRVCYLVELGDYGWNSGHENKTTFFRAVKLHNRKGPKPLDNWLIEGDWKETFKGQAAYCIPTMHYIDGGSAGLTFNPGESMGSKYDNHFVYSAYQRGIYTFKFEPQGGGLKAVNVENFWKGGHIIDTEFSPDGRLFVTDYVSTSNAKGNKGVIYIMKDDALLKKPSVISAAKILQAGFKNQPVEKLYRNLFHKDMRVRLFSQFELAEKGAASQEIFLKAAGQTKDEVARLHGIWGLGQLARKDSSVCSKLAMFASDENWRVRSQVAKVIGEAKDPKYAEIIFKMLNDVNSRVRFFALTAAGKLGGVTAVEKIIKAAELNNDQDVFIRHSAVAGLIFTESADSIFKYAKHSHPAVRRVSLLALARLKDVRIASFLKDSDQSIVQEAIRCVDRVEEHKIVLEASKAFSTLVKGTPAITETNQERILQWCFRSGNESSARAVASFTLNTEASSRMRQIALNDLARWEEKIPVDPVLGQLREINKNRYKTGELLKNTLAALLKQENDKSMSSLVNTMALGMGIGLDKNKIISQVIDPVVKTQTRLDYYKQLIKKKDPQIVNVTKVLFSDKNLEVRTAAYIAMAGLNREVFTGKIKELGRNGADLKAVYSTLAAVEDHGVDYLLNRGLNLLLKGRHAVDSQLELLMAAEKSTKQHVKDLLKKYKESLPKNDVLSSFKPAMYGGNAKNGRKLVYEQGVGQCIICHKIEGKGGIVAPDLSEIAAKKHYNPKYALESIVNPNAFIVPGFGNITVTLKDGSSVVGSLFMEDKLKITLKSPDGKTKDIALKDIKARTAAISSMPPMGAVLKKHEIRDIIAYLSTLKKKGSH